MNKTLLISITLISLLLLVSSASAQSISDARWFPFNESEFGWVAQLEDGTSWCWGDQCFTQKKCAKEGRVCTPRTQCCWGLYCEEFLNDGSGIGSCKMDTQSPTFSNWVWPKSRNITIISNETYNDTWIGNITFEVVRVPLDFQDLINIAINRWKEVITNFLDPIIESVNNYIQERSIIQYNNGYIVTTENGKCFIVDDICVLISTKGCDIDLFKEAIDQEWIFYDGFDGCMISDGNVKWEQRC